MPSDILVSERIIIVRNGLERRAQLDLWNNLIADDPDRIIQISEIDKENILVLVGQEPEIQISLRDERAILNTLLSTDVLIDMSGLSHNVWAPILKSAHNTRVRTRVMYVEPETYRPHSTPASATLFDLSESIEGLAPLPGFARLSGPEDENDCLFVALLGFEGNRPERLVLQLDPTPTIIPIIGVPGFQIEYPAFTVACNRVLLNEYNSHSQMRYARASCPFEVYEILKDIRRDYPDSYIYIAPVGTKPHSLGAILYAISDPIMTEIMFDYPVRKAGRTQGIGLIHIYDFGDFHDL
ncbi:MAG: hypothetical protein JAZ15_05680 [Candidatus Thiodiazotropha endolucinida]|nr:hypothetical protein [Candidatus Thiodiazotropha taylori]